MAVVLAKEVQQLVIARLPPKRNIAQNKMHMLEKGCLDSEVYLDILASQGYFPVFSWTSYG